MRSRASSLAHAEFQRTRLHAKRWLRQVPRRAQIFRRPPLDKRVRRRVEVGSLIGWLLVVCVAVERTHRSSSAREQRSSLQGPRRSRSHGGASAFQTRVLAQNSCCHTSALYVILVVVLGKGGRAPEALSDYCTARYTKIPKAARGLYCSATRRGGLGPRQA